MPGLVTQPSFPGRHPFIVFSPGGEGVGEKTDETARVLIVEDDYLAAMDMEAALTEAGYQIVGFANTAEEAVRLAQAERPALVVMDIRLNGPRDGVDAALEIFKTSGVRCIFATAHHTPQTRSRAEPASPLGWLPKPYSSASLVAIVRRALHELSN